MFAKWTSPRWGSGDGSQDRWRIGDRPAGAISPGFPEELRASALAEHRGRLAGPAAEKGGEIMDIRIPHLAGDILDRTGAVQQQLARRLHPQVGQVVEQRPSAHLLEQ